MLIKRLSLKKILSFNDAVVELGPLNVLIGPNAVGKSNLIDIIALLRAAPTGLASEINLGGGIRQWLWLGDRVPPWPTATVECELTLSRGQQVGPLLYELQFTDGPNGFEIRYEQLAGRSRQSGGAARDAYFTRTLNSADFGRLALQQMRAKVQGGIMVSPSESVLSQFKNPADPTPITEVGKHFAEIRIFREFRTGPRSPARYGVSTGVPKDALVDGSDNLALVLHDFYVRGPHERIKNYLRRFCERFKDVKIDIGDGLARIYLHEADLSEMLSAIRMSDGTLKFLSLLAALFHPKSPPLICIEEPEVGLHPDALQIVADVLLEASHSMQLIVTTHSDALVDALTDHPETVLVCDRDFDKGTQMKRLSKKELKAWLDRYTLGQLWRKGEIGGGRW